MEKKEVQKYVFVGLILVLIYVSYLIVRPFLSALIASAVLAYILHPLYKKVESKIKKKGVSAFLISTLVVLVIVLPLIGVANAIIQEAASAYNSGAIAAFSRYLTGLVGSNAEINQLLSNFLSRSLEYIINTTSQFLISVPSKLFHFVIAIYAFFYLLINGEAVVEKVKKNLPFKNKEKLVRYLGDTTYAMVYGLFVIALIEFAIASVGFKILGIKAPLLWGLVIGIFGLIPFLGPAMVWIPIAAVKLIQAEYTTGILLILLGVLLTVIDHFGRPWVIGRKSRMHPVLIVIGVIGGASVIGFIGVIVGPLLLSFLLMLCEEYYSGENANEA